MFLWIAFNLFERNGYQHMEFKFDVMVETPIKQFYYYGQVCIF